jgi:hypothetical protein
LWVSARLKAGRVKISEQEPSEWRAEGNETEIANRTLQKILPALVNLMQPTAHSKALNKTPNSKTAIRIGSTKILKTTFMSTSPLSILSAAPYTPYSGTSNSNL